MFDNLQNIKHKQYIGDLIETIDFKPCYFHQPSIKTFSNDRSSHPHVFLEKGVLKTCSKFTEHPCRSAISIKLLCNFIEITLRHGCSLVNLLHVFRTPFPKNTFGRLLLNFVNFFLEDWSFTLLSSICQIALTTRDNRLHLLKS